MTEDPFDTDDDFLDGCDLPMDEHADDALTASLRPLFPQGDPSKAPEWRKLKDAGAFDGP